MFSVATRARRFAVFSIIATVVSFSTSGAAAQTPAAGDCDLDPVTLPLFDATPAAQIAASPVAMETGISLDDDGVREVLEGLVVCMNSGDAAYRYAIFTDRFLASMFADPTITYQPQFEEEIALGPLQPEGRLRLVDVAEVTTLNNGAISVTVSISSTVSTFDDTLILANVDGVWLIDDVVELNPPQ